MSTLWTPHGEHPVGGTGPSSPEAGQATPGDEPSEEELAAEIERQLLATPAEEIVATHVYNLFQLAQLHLSQHPPQLAQARVAIDAITALVEGMSGRLGQHEPDLVEGLGGLRMAFVQIHAAATAATGQAGSAATGQAGSAGQGGEASQSG